MNSTCNDTGCSRLGHNNATRRHRVLHSIYFLHRQHRYLLPDIRINNNSPSLGYHVQLVDGTSLQTVDEGVRVDVAGERWRVGRLRSRVFIKADLYPLCSHFYLNFVPARQ